LATGLNATRDDPACQLRERMLRPGRDDSNGRDSQLIRIALILKSWKLFQDGKTVTMRKSRRSSMGEEPFPSI
jgi:hypothetical protein